VYQAGYVEVMTMHASNRLKSRPAEAGFTLSELLVACAILSVGLVAVATGFGLGVDGVEAGRQQSTAVFLAEQRIEQAKDLAMRQTGLVQLTVANLPATEAYGTIAGAPPSYRRTTTITTNPRHPRRPGGRDRFYRPVTGRGVSPRSASVSLSIFLANR
jgi:prepilin-type N-terminal cleavage/methylation domain-containing protein